MSAAALVFGLAVVGTLLFTVVVSWGTVGDMWPRPVAKYAPTVYAVAVGAFGAICVLAWGWEATAAAWPWWAGLVASWGALRWMGAR